MTYRDIILPRLADKSHYELAELASRLRAKWILLDGEVDIDILTQWILKGDLGCYEDLDRDLLLDDITQLYLDVMELFQNDLLTITDFLDGNWE